MADPEDGDDLFADLYDADESTNRTTAAAEAPKPTDVGATNPAPAGDGVGQDFAPAPVSTYESHPAQPSEFDPGYHNGSGNAYGTPATIQAPLLSKPSLTGQELKKTAWVTPIAIHGFDYNSGCRKEFPICGLKSLWAVEYGLFEEIFTDWLIALAFQPWKGGKTKCGLGGQSTYMFEERHYTTTNVHQSLQIRSGYSSICYTESSGGSKGTSPGALDQDNRLRKSTATQGPLSQTIYSTADTI
ncbi:unnamed protein product [Penicillium nalgiovense]|nr:unnamed protein product [Penicillium nalgiovense]